MSSIICRRCDFKPGQVIDESYEVLRSLGEGTFGHVYKVRTRDGQIKALKILKLWEVVESGRESLLARFDMEYETGRIESQYLVHSQAKGSVEGNPYIVMEFCEGGDLLEGISKGRKSLESAAREVLYGLRDLHNNGKVHRDLKPENVLLDSHNTALLTDFGISGDQNKRLTERGLFGVPKERFGTMLYMPPEQFDPRKGNATVLPTTDIFSYGVMIYQLITGNYPFGDIKSESEIPGYFARVKAGDWNVDRINQSHNQWIPLLDGCLKPDYKMRLQKTDDVLRTLPAGTLPEPEPLSQTRCTQFNRDFSYGAILRVMQGMDAGKIFWLNSIITPTRRILHVGRNDNDIRNDIVAREMDNIYVSRRHCTLEVSADGCHWYLRDGQWCKESGLALGQWKESLNGTYVNSTEVTPRGIELRPGDIISIGEVKMRIEGTPVNKEK